MKLKANKLIQKKTQLFQCKYLTVMPDNNNNIMQTHTVLLENFQNAELVYLLCKRILS